jgi:hypothetical protein
MPVFFVDNPSVADLRVISMTPFASWISGPRVVVALALVATLTTTNGPAHALATATTCAIAKQKSAAKYAEDWKLQRHFRSSQLT